MPGQKTNENLLTLESSGFLCLQGPNALEYSMDENYTAYLKDLPNLRKTMPGSLVAYFQGRRVADGKDAKELSDNIPSDYREEALFIKAVISPQVKFRRPFFSRHF